ncbi:hypothetical protein KMW28_11985 [Flammeovirga yaeyamensis]|uniref:Outer membrane protein beta-barrel domain-containing protein n=1 Tax=Flammeovirga yaeyamensis TaxID=367791 RepID=A0AAX1MYS0_9BACT|nr:hypothetical protein [Flammeovirga yaeyamensis]MBB3696116.1 hypothetical protein [Flammeovirga yaeyamensis]NMF34800.1 hypothetical protein [Flammeovirga yaeyamensis]QWG00372.1 hypothetical protein KMW28_11985 [Flammeovirga yaeyamensis]
MIKKIYNKVLLLVLLTCSCFGQDFEIPTPKKYLEISPLINSYRGDLGSFNQINGGINLAFIYNKPRRGNLRLDFTYLYVQASRLRGKDYVPPIQEPIPNNYFQSQTLNFSLSYMFYIINKKNIKLYLAQGLGVFYFDPLDENGESYFENISDNSRGYYQTRNESETYSKFTLSLPTRFGLMYYFPTNFGIGLSGTFYNPFTDYLDNISDFGTVKGYDNVFSLNFNFHIPLQYQKLKK